VAEALSLSLREEDKEGVALSVGVSSGAGLSPSCSTRAFRRNAEESSFSSSRPCARPTEYGRVRRKTGVGVATTAVASSAPLPPSKNLLRVSAISSIIQALSARVAKKDKTSTARRKRFVKIPPGLWTPLLEVAIL
jgi:hypothetical protein